MLVCIAEPDTVSQLLSLCLAPGCLILTILNLPFLPFEVIIVLGHTASTQISAPRDEGPLLIHLRIPYGALHIKGVQKTEVSWVNNNVLNSRNSKIFWM